MQLIGCFFPVDCHFAVAHLSPRAGRREAIDQSRRVVASQLRSGRENALGTRARARRQRLSWKTMQTLSIGRVQRKLRCQLHGSRTDGKASGPSTASGSASCWSWSGRWS